MRNYDPRQSFADAVSARYHDVRGDEDECVALLKDLAGAGPALELAVGTGRIALPLAEQGLRVDGIDFAEAMIARLREKPGGETLDVRLGDFVEVDVEGRYALVFIVWNSFFNVLSQADQVRCFENVAAHLDDGGVFLIEAFVPAFLHRLDDQQELKTESVGTDSVRIGALVHDPANQMLEQTHVTLTAGEDIRMDPVVQRYAWPHELDLMAQLAGLELKERWSGWRREPFDATSARHVSVYGR